jgi:competence protein ComEC
LISFAANIIVVPVFSFIIIPLGLFVILFVAINSFLAEFVVEITLYILKNVIAVIEFFSSLNFAAISTFKPTLFELFLYYAIFCSIFLILKGGSFKRYRFLVVALSLLALTDTAYWINQRYLRDDVRITFLDVGQGSASLIELPNGKTVLIDGGGYSNNIYFDMGKIVIAPFLLSKKIFTIDTLILSHANSDHLNGLIYIAKNFNVKSLWSNGEASDTLSYGDLIKTVKKRKIIHEICSGYQKREMERVLFEVLYPAKNFKTAGEKWRDSNNNSLTVRVSFGETSILFPGDIEHQAERELIGLSKSKLKSSILLVPHHGSKTSSSKEFIDCVMPEIAIISSGYKNRYGFPDIKTVKRIKDKNIKIIRVDQRGSVIFDINKEDYRYRFYNNN